MVDSELAGAVDRAARIAYGMSETWRQSRMRVRTRVLRDDSGHDR
jgi:hypothetical protein